MSLSEESDFDDDFDDDIGGKRGEERSGGRDGDDFDFGESYTESPARDEKRKGSGNDQEEGKSSTHLVNQPFDEAVDLSDEDSLGTSVDTIDPQNSPKQNLNELGAASKNEPPASTSSFSSKRGDSPPRESRPTPKAEYGDDDDDGMSGASSFPNPRPSAAAAGSRSPGRSTRSDDSDASQTGEEDDDEEEDSDDAGLDESQDATPGKAKRVQGEYSPSDYAHLNVSAEVKDLWNYIGRYKPHNIELETKLRCFIPDFIPAVGEIDAFIKVPPPGKEEEGEKRLGLTVLDEPASHQSDPTVLDLQLRAISKVNLLFIIFFFMNEIFFGQDLECPKDIKGHTRPRPPSTFYISTTYSENSGAHFRRALS